jgi:endogenous inhibitor of DNA gyrase (YacG/DUF329 family)
VTAEQRDCPECGTPFTWTSAAPRQKYCSTRCKHRWHQARRKPRRRRQDPTRHVARPPVPAAGVAPTTEVGLAAQTACPHCRKPVALAAWLIPPAAANVKDPPRHADTISDGP